MSSVSGQTHKRLVLGVLTPEASVSIAFKKEGRTFSRITELKGKKVNSLLQLAKNGLSYKILLHFLCLFWLHGNITGICHHNSQLGWPVLTRIKLHFPSSQHRGWQRLPSLFALTEWVARSATRTPPPSFLSQGSASVSHSACVYQRQA